MQDYFDWWRETLSTCVPQRWRGADSRAQRLILRKSGVDLSTAGEIRRLPEDNEEEHPVVVFFLESEIKGRPLLELESTRYIVRTLSPARLPGSHAQAMAEFDLQSSTPFSDEDVYRFVLRRPDSIESAPTQYAIVKRKLLDPLIASLRAAGKPLGGLAFMPPGDSAAPVGVLSAADTASLNGASKWRTSALGICALVLLAGMLGTWGHLYFSYASAQTRAEDEMPALEAKAKTVRDKLNVLAARVAEVNSLRRNLATQRPMAEVWEELSKVLPDSAYLTDLAIKDGSASMAGFSDSATSIIAPIEGSPMFEGAEFASPVVKVPGRSGERFDVKLTLLGR